MSFVKDNLPDKIPLITTAVLSRPQSTILLCKEVEWTTLASPFIKLYKLHTNATSFCTMYKGLKLFLKEHLYFCLLTNMAVFCDHSRTSNIAFLICWAQMSDLDFGLIWQNISNKKASFHYQGCPLSFVIKLLCSLNKYDFKLIL